MMNDRAGHNTIDENQLVVRSNWKGFLEEFNMAVGVWRDEGGSFQEFHSMMSDESCSDETWVPKMTSSAHWESIGPEQLTIDDSRVPMTNFEAKYLECGEPVYELSIRRKDM